jgi:hypothetical protein
MWAGSPAFVCIPNFELFLATVMFAIDEHENEVPVRSIHTSASKSKDERMCVKTTMEPNKQNRSVQAYTVRQQSISYQMFHFLIRLSRLRNPHTHPSHTSNSNNKQSNYASQPKQKPSSLTDPLIHENASPPHTTHSSTASSPSPSSSLSSPSYRLRLAIPGE